jgi:hypothetical protein
MNLKKVIGSLTVLGALCLVGTANAQQTPEVKEKKEEVKPTPEKHWYERITVGGYTQLRYSRLLESNPELKFETDKSIGQNGGFLLRRGRLQIRGDVSDFLYIYLQPDFANVIGEAMHAPQIRDWYGDIAVDKNKEFRFRVGQSKVPYGFENMQSSQNRAPIERSDALNTAVPGERDIGIMAYWAPEDIRKRFKYLVDSGLKGSGDYGVVGLGAYNGQSINLKEKNNNQHVVLHLTYPFKIGEQYLELGAHAYTGKYNVTKADKITGPENNLDARVAGTIVVYPQPIGFQAEFNAGKGPELVGNEVLTKTLHGGYAMTMVRVNGITPYIRAAYYEGGRKNETNSPHNSIRELESGIEVQFKKWVEITAAFNTSSREVNDKKQVGHLARLQLQFNY